MPVVQIHYEVLIRIGTYLENEGNNCACRSDTHEALRKRQGKEPSYIKQP